MTFLLLCSSSFCSSPSWSHLWCHLLARAVVIPLLTYASCYPVWTRLLGSTRLAQLRVEPSSQNWRWVQVGNKQLWGGSLGLYRRQMLLCPCTRRALRVSADELRQGRTDGGWKISQSQGPDLLPPQSPSSRPSVPSHLGLTGLQYTAGPYEMWWLWASASLSQMLSSSGRPFFSWCIFLLSTLSVVVTSCPLCNGSIVLNITYSIFTHPRGQHYHTHFTNKDSEVQRGQPSLHGLIPTKCL